MGLMDEVNKLAEKAKHAAAEHPDQVRKAIDQAEDQIDRRTGGKHASQLDSAGDKVAVYYGAANGDPAVFDRPEELVLDRTPNEHVAFGGGGPHFCLGSHFGRIEITEMMTQLLTDIASSNSATVRLMKSLCPQKPDIPPINSIPGRRSCRTGRARVAPGNARRAGCPARTSHGWNSCG